MVAADTQELAGFENEREAFSQHDARASAMIVRAAAGAIFFAILFFIAPLQAQGPKCSPHRVTAQLPFVTMEPRTDGTYIDVLEAGDVVCVVREQTFGGVGWNYIQFKVKKPGERIPVEGWVQRRDLTRIAMGQLDAGPQAAPPASPGAQTPAIARPSPTASYPEDVVRFEEPIPFGPYPVVGSTIRKLSDSIPLFPPVDGQPESLWQKNCSSCHKWDRQTLCQQGASYLANPRNVLRQKHPFGGSYKVALMRWSKNDCK